LSRDQGAPAVESWDVPAHSVLTLRPATRDYCVSVFVLNEGERIRTQLRRMTTLTDSVDVVVADGGSIDGALDEAFLRSTAVTTLLTKTGPGRLSAQMRMAFAHALGQGYRGVVTIDGNGKDDPEDIPRLVRALEEGYDHVQGSRFLPGGRAINTPWARLLGIRLIHAPLISWAAGVRYTDTTNGFRAYSRRLLTDPRVAPFRSVFSGYELHYYLAIRAARLAHRTVEVPVTRRYPARGRVPTKIKPLTGHYVVLKSLVQACLGRFDPKEPGTAAKE